MDKIFVLVYSSNSSNGCHYHKSFKTKAEAIKYYRYNLSITNEDDSDTKELEDNNKVQIQPNCWYTLVEFANPYKS